MCGVLAADPAGELPRSRTVETLRAWVGAGAGGEAPVPGRNVEEAAPEAHERLMWAHTVVASKGPEPSLPAPQRRRGARWLPQGQPAGPPAGAASQRRPGASGPAQLLGRGAYHTGASLWPQWPSLKCVAIRVPELSFQGCVTRVSFFKRELWKLEDTTESLENLPKPILNK